MITRTTQETLRLSIGAREYVGWVDEFEDGWLAWGAGVHSELFPSYGDALEHIRTALIVQAQADADNPHRSEVADFFAVTSQINPDRSVGVAA